MGSARHLMAAACGGMFLFGVVMAVLGAVLPVVATRAGIDLAQAGGLFVAMNVAMLGASLVLGQAMDRAGLQAPLAAGPLLVAGALAGLGRGGSHGALVTAMVGMGLGGGALNAATNTLVADLHEDPKRKNAALNLLGVFFGIGALAIPFQMATLLERWGLTAILDGAAVLCGLVTAWVLALRFPPAKQRAAGPGVSRSGAAAGGLAGMRRLLGEPLIRFWGLLLFFESGNEFVLGGYASTYLVKKFGATVEWSSYALAAYWAAVMAARLVLSRVLLRVGGHRLVLGGAAAASLGAVLAAAAETPGAAAGALALAGFSLAGVYPTVLGLAGAEFRETSGTAFGMLFTMGLVGGITWPWLAGQIAQRSGVGAVFPLAAAGFSAIFCLELAAGRVRSGE